MLPRPLTDVTTEQVAASFATNVFGPMAIVRALIHPLIAAQGLVVTINSCSDRLPHPVHGVYAMTKAANASYMRTLAAELHYFNVCTLTVVTGFITTNIVESAPKIAFPPDTLFSAIEGNIYNSLTPPMMSAKDYATAVVKEVMRGKGVNFGPFGRWFGTREWIWLGGMSTQFWLMTVFGESFTQWLLVRMWGLSRVNDAKLKP